MRFWSKCNFSVVFLMYFFKQSYFVFSSSQKFCKNKVLVKGPKTCSSDYCIVML